MTKFKVIDPKGVHFGGVQIPKGETFTSAKPHGAAVLSFIHFKQVEEVSDDAEEKAEAKAKAKAEKEAADAEAKAKAEAEKAAKGSK